jgi:hypothetical protein
MMLWGNLNYNYSEASMGWVGTSNFSGASYKSRGWAEPNLVAYMESHDEERMMYRNLQFGNSAGSYNIKNLQTALQRVKLAAAFYFTIPGPKMIWQFGELGYDVSIDFNGRVGNKPIRWNYYNDPDRNRLYKTFAALTDLKQYDAFESSDFSLNASGPVKRLNISHESMDVYVVGNFDVTGKEVIHSFSENGWWYNYFTGDSIFVADLSPIVDTLDPGEFFIYTTVKLPNPEFGIENIDSNIIKEFSLRQNYPNPFNTVTNIEYAVSTRQFISLKIYDILGREVKTLVSGEQPPGVYQIKFDATGLSSGVYLYNYQAGSFNETRKMILMK